MNVGPCPVCGKELNIYKSLEIDEWTRWDVDCKTKGCIINALEWNYNDKDDLLKVVASSQRLALKRDPVTVKTDTIHFSVSGKVKDVKCSSKNGAKKSTKDKKKVTCYHCKNTAGYKSSKL